MRRPSRGLGLRWRIMIAFLGGALAVSALVAGTTYLLADRYLINQRVDASTEQSFGNVRFAVRFLARAAEAKGESEEEGEETAPRPAVSLAELVGLLEARGQFEVLLLEGDQWFSSSVAITPASVPRELSRLVSVGQVAYEFREGERDLVFGSPVPGSGLTAFFFYPVDDVEDALGLLWRVLLGVAVGAVLLAAIAGFRVSRRVVHPVRRASEAARRVAEGLLETRLPVEERDEIGTLADSFNEMAAALEERIQHERRFVGDVSHELRTPLTTLRASTDYLLGRAAELPPELRRAVELLSADLEYLQRLVDDLLDISRVEAGRVQMSLEPLNLGDLVREVVARRTRAGEHRVDVVIESEPERLVTMADKQRLERVVGNLVDNALTHGQGREVRVRVASENGSLLLAVEDRGPGIPAFALTRVFERFFKADPARPRSDGRGSGLGLAIARENAHLHEGEIEVESRSGEGTRFTFRLPRKTPEPAE